VELARSPADVERLAAAWDRVEWGREEAERDYFLTRLDARPGVTGLFGILVLNGDEPVAALAARREDRRLPTAFGYRVVYAPRVRLLQVVDGGVVVQHPAALEPLVGALRTELARIGTDAVAVPVLPVDSPLFAALERLGGPLEQQRFLTTYTRRRLVLPESFEAFLASRTQKVRRGIRYDSKKLVDALGDELAVEIMREPESFERLVAEVDGIAVSTYQRALGAGFADTPEQRGIIRIGLEKGYVRAYLLYHRGTPIAYWVGSVYRGTMFLRATGFDHAYARNRVGVYLLMRVIDDLCADPAVDVLDFGPGDAEYKRLFTNDGVVERNLVVFAPTFRARRINATRTAILGSARLVRRVVDATRLTARVRSRWKSRLRSAG
jgi:hypothetical protein